MGKIKLNLASGNVVEKPIINYYKLNNNTYMVLDEEKTGSAGLPIILVSKIFDNKAIKVIDPTEWHLVRDSLKSIIAGNPVEFENAPAELNADDIYYTQLILPVTSFDALKNNYKPVISEPVTPVPPVTPIVEPVIPEATINSIPEPVALTPEEPIIPETPVAPVMPDLSSPIVPPVSEVVEPAPVNQEVINPTVLPNEPITPVSNEVPLNDYQEIKDTFMKACENMFDALVVKIQNKK